MKLVLVRHGQTLFNKMDLTQGWCDSPLTDLGIEQATKARDAIQDLHIDAAYSSVSERAYDTAVIVLGERQLEVKRDKRVKEINFGIFEGSPNAIKDSMRAQFCEGFYHDFTSVQGESTGMMLERYKDMLHELEEKHADETVLIGAHGYSLTAFIQEITGGPIQFLKNAQVCILEGNHGHYKVLEYRNPTEEI